MNAPIPRILIESMWRGRLFGAQWKPAIGGSLDVLEPATGAVITRVGNATAEDVRNAAAEARAPRRSSDARSHLPAFSAARRAPAAGRAHHERRRAADGGDRARAHDATQAPLARRALARAFAASLRRAVRRARAHHARSERVDGRAERPPRAGDGEPRLSPFARPHRRRGRGQDARARQRGGALVSGVVNLSLSLRLSPPVVPAHPISGLPEIGSLSAHVG